MAIKYPISFKVDDAGLKKASSSLKKFGANAAKIGAAAGAAIGGAAVFSIKKFADFDQALNKSIAIMGDVSDALRGDMADAAREVAKQTTFSAEEAAESFFFLASAGLDAEQSIAAMPQVAKFAQAGMFDMALATDLATDAQSALGLASDDTEENLRNLTRVTDVFVKANTLANTSVEQLATAFTSKAGNALKTVGKDVEEGAAALAVFADQGIKGERAGTLLTNTIFGLTDAVEKNGGQMEELGIQVFDAQGNMRSFEDIIKDFEGALGDMSTEQQIATLSQLGFTKQAREGILALNDNSTALGEYEEKLNDAGGTADEVANNQLETFNAQMDLLKSRVEDAALELGEQLLPYVTDFTEDLGPLIDENLPKFVDAIDDTIEGVKELAERFKPHINELLPNITSLFEDLEDPANRAGDALLEIAEVALVEINNLLEDPGFKRGLNELIYNLADLAENAADVVDSGLGEFFFELGRSSISGGLNVTAEAVGVLGGALGSLANGISALSGELVEFEDVAGSLEGLTGIDLEQIIRGFLEKQTGVQFGPGGVPGLANGGVVQATPGGTLALIGEGGRDEAVIPLDRAGNLTTGGGGNTFNIKINAGMGADGQRIGQQIVDEIIKFERTSGKVFARA